MFDAIAEGKEASVKFYNEWVEDVKKHVPKERLLVFSVKEGWNPLCSFLGVPVPNRPFPNTNDSKQMKERFKKMKRVAYTVVLGFPILIGVGAYYLGAAGPIKSMIDSVSKKFLK